mmetsp:Transcript_122437/g.240310  ORF Transcript_122437/g.240310 Transcript_122437/m.240310 type:complete len:232 (+) Transcript_122437:90-785(+)|eukprot:CAMPEP_0170399380 /NCGR_PEP_ID=MMETSP0117_2-20130122/23928_1 /TAXON_ID=400756 /ORGANISM="Durinskia baltica, Strain CSIRO CS-38" /LENGTH=231 /DNA_ID=CAMNT_0010656047 /DNA_START=85 /DNA_END=780 /DNA_ORIENTATION=-
MSLKIIIMGVGGVGKSAITNRFVVGRWVEKYDPTIEESYQATVDIDGKAMQVEILDTAGQDAYTPLRETFMHTGDGFLLVYSIVDDQTLEELREIREQILRVHPNRKVPMMVVGNKADMKKRVVSKQEGKTLADEFGAGFIEVSAKENLRVKEAFQTLVQTILSKNPKAAQDSADNAAGVFGGGKADPADDANDEPMTRKKSKKAAADAKKSTSRDSTGSDKEKKGKCVLL